MRSDNGAVLAREHAFARALVNSGRLSVPATLHTSALVTPDRAGESFEGWMLPGAPMDDAPVAVDGRPTWLLRQAAAGEFTLLVFGDTPVTLPDDLPVPVGLRRVQRPGSATAPGDLLDTEGHLSRRYDGRPGTVYLLRPDQHVAARWRAFDADALRAALRRSLALQ